MSRKHLVAKLVAACLTALFVFSALTAPTGSASADDPYAPAPTTPPLESVALPYVCSWPTKNFDLTAAFHLPGTLVPDSVNGFTVDLTVDEYGVLLLNLAYPKTIDATVLAQTDAGATTPTSFVLGTVPLSASMTIAKVPTPPVGSSAYTFVAVPGTLATIAPTSTGSQQLSVPTQLDLELAGTTTPCVLATGVSPMVGTAVVAALTPTIRTASARTGLAVTAWAAPNAPGVGTVTASTSERITQHYTKKVWVRVRVKGHGRHHRRFKRVRRVRRFTRVVTRQFNTRGTLNAQGKATLDLAGLGLRRGSHLVTISWAGSSVIASYVVH